MVDMLAPDGRCSPALAQLKTGKLGSSELRRWLRTSGASAAQADKMVQELGLDRHDIAASDLALAITGQG